MLGAARASAAYSGVIPEKHHLAFFTIAYILKLPGGRGGKSLSGCCCVRACSIVSVEWSINRGRNTTALKGLWPMKNKSVLTFLEPATSQARRVLTVAFFLFEEPATSTSQARFMVL